MQSVIRSLLALVLSSGAVAATNGVARLKTLKATEWTIPDLDLKLVRIPPGSFVMGTPLQEQDRREDEIQHTATITSPFYMGVYEVTQKEYYQLMVPEFDHDRWQYARGPLHAGLALFYRERTERGDYTGGRLNLQHPMECVSWKKAQAFCRKITAREREAGRLPEGYVYRLPTEAEWEYACRAGTTGPFNVRGDRDDAEYLKSAKFLDSFANVGGGKTATVGTRKPNAWGLHDMHGNVYEWCQDWYGPYPAGTVTDPLGPATGEQRIARGGCFNGPAPYSPPGQIARGDSFSGAGPFLRSASRYRFSPDVEFYAILGFRIVLGRALTIAAGENDSPSTPEPTSTTYLGPVAVAATQDGTRLFVAAADAQKILVIDTAGGTVTRSIDVPGSPTAMAPSPNGKVLYVTCAAPESWVCAVDVAAGRVSASIPAGHTATGLAMSPDGTTLYVCNRFSNNVSVIDLATGKQRATVPTTREPVGAAITPDGRSVYVINHLPNDRSDAFDVAAEVTVIDTATYSTSAIRLPNGSSSLRSLCVSPDGKYVYTAHILARYQMPTTQLDRGWTMTNALSIIDAVAKKRINTVLLDDVDLGAANPWGVAVTADGKTICVTHAGTHEVSLIDAQALMQKLLAMPRRNNPNKATGDTYDSWTAGDVVNDLAFLVGLRQRVRLGGGDTGNHFTRDEVRVNGPRGLAVVGNHAYIASYFTDTLAVVDLDSKPSAAVAAIPLGPEPKLTVQRRGEMLFHDAAICFQKWQSCASCHPDGRVDTLNWDLMNDGMGNPKNVRSMLLAHKTPPAMASGVRGTAEDGVRAGIRHILFAVRPEEEAAAMDAYARSLEPVPSPHLVNGTLSPAASRGRKLFFDEKIGCAKCHPAPLYTDNKLYDVGSRGRLDHRDTFDTPTLIECWRTGPYMHDGRYVTVKELLTGGKHGHQGSRMSALGEKQLDDLIAFVLSL